MQCKWGGGLKITARAINLLSNITYCLIERMICLVVNISIALLSHFNLKYVMKGSRDTNLVYKDPEFLRGILKKKLKNEEKRNSTITVDCENLNFYSIKSSLCFCKSIFWALRITLPFDSYIFPWNKWSYKPRLGIVYIITLPILFPCLVWTAHPPSHSIDVLSEEAIKLVLNSPFISVTLAL